MTGPREHLPRDHGRSEEHAPDHAAGGEGSGDDTTGGDPAAGDSAAGDERAGGQAAEDGPPGRVGRHGPTLVLTALAFAATTVAVMQTVVSPILPRLQHSLGVSSSTVAWVLTGNLLASAVATPLFGRLGDLRGRKRFLMVALAAVTVGSVIAALSTTFPVLLLGRALQGVGGGVVPLALSVVRDQFPRERTAGSIAVIGATISLGSTFGTLMSGLIADHADYHLLFWLAAAVAALSLTLVGVLVPEGVVRRRSGRVDVVGAVALSGWLVALLGSVSQGGRLGWTHPLVLGGLGAAVGLFAAWFAWSVRCPEPLVDLRVMARRPVLLANCSGLLTGTAMYGSGMLWAPFLQTDDTRYGYGFGASVLGASLITLPGALGNLAAAPVAGRLINRHGPRPALVAGPMLGGLAFALLVPLNSHMWSFMLVSGLFGFGIGLAFAGMPAVINANVPQEMTGVANGINSVLRTIGGAVSTAVLGAVLSAVTISGGVPAVTAYRICFGCLAVACAISTTIAFAIPAARGRRTGRGAGGDGGGQPSVTLVSRRAAVAADGADR